jgi:hypothetical protein
MHLKIEIPFQENVYIRQCMLRWTLTNQKAKHNARSILIWWTIVFTIGILSGIQDEQYVNGITVAGSIFIVYGLWTLTVLIKGKLKYKKQLHEIAQDLKNNNYVGDYEFTDSFIRYIDPQRDIKLDWATFDSYTCKLP